MPPDVQGDGTHRPTGDRGFGPVARPEPSQLLLPTSGHEPVGRHQREAFPTGEILRSRSTQQHMRRPFHHHPRSKHRIADTAHAGHCPGTARRPVSHRRVMFHATGSCEDGTPASVELLGIFEDQHGSDYRVRAPIHRRAAPSCLLPSSG
jgi:hypothetical protein